MTACVQPALAILHGPVSQALHKARPSCGMLPGNTRRLGLGLAGKGSSFLPEESWAGD